jgi:hypothetical protein
MIASMCLPYWPSDEASQGAATGKKAMLSNLARSAMQKATLHRRAAKRGRELARLVAKKQ